MSERSVIIYRLGSLGDTVVALPCFHTIARAFETSKRLVLTNVPVSSKAAALDLVLGGSGLIDGIVDYTIGLRSPAAIWDLRRRIRATGADTLIYLSAPRGAKGVRRDLLFFRLCGIRTVIGAPVEDDTRLHRIDPVTQALEPEAERLARTMASLGPIDLDDRANWDLRLSVDEKASGDRAAAPVSDRPIFAINIGGKAARNDWGRENWKALLALLSDPLSHYGLVAVGGTADWDSSAALLADWAGPTVNLCGKLAPRETAALLRHAALFIGHDSGPMHLAAAVGVPTVGIFGDNNKPRMWHPYGRQHRPVHDMRGVRSIPPEQVRDAALEIVAATR